MKLLVVEDERQLCDDIAEDLELERYTDWTPGNAFSWSLTTWLF